MSNSLLPPAQSGEQAALRVPVLADFRDAYLRSLHEPEVYWTEQADTLTWYHPPQADLDADDDADSEATEAAVAASPQDLEALKAAAGPVFKVCKSCHESYRIED